MSDEDPSRSTVRTKIGKMIAQTEIRKVIKAMKKTSIKEKLWDLVPEWRQTMARA